MITLFASEIAEIVGGELHAPANLTITESSTFDSRDVLPGGIFFALKGEHADGHDFLADAFARGCAIAIVSHAVNYPSINVPDVVVALTKLATHVRKELKNLTVIGITGSQGKTTTKDLLQAILSIHHETIAPLGSLNNELGVPLTLLRCTRSTEYCIVEMGARHKGDIAALTAVAQPKIGVVLTVGNAHVGEFGSREIIAASKFELIESLPSDGTAILGSYDSFTAAMGAGKVGHVLSFGELPTDQVRAADVEIREGRAHFDLVTPLGREAVALRLVGASAIPNALAAAAVASVLEIPLDVIAGALSTAEVVSKWRMQIHELSNILLINDAYNANPESMSAALRTLSLFAQERGGQSWAFLGKMHELGESSAQLHAEIGTLAQVMGIDHLVCVGAPEYAGALGADSSIVVHQCRDQVQAQELGEHFAPGDVLLVKASRSEGLEKLAALFVESYQGEGEPEQ